MIKSFLSGRNLYGFLELPSQLTSSDVPSNVLRAHIASGFIVLQLAKHSSLESECKDDSTSTEEKT